MSSVITEFMPFSRHNLICVSVRNAYKVWLRCVEIRQKNLVCINGNVVQIQRPKLVIDYVCKVSSEPTSTVNRFC